jgi:hypothetical protein
VTARTIIHVGIAFILLGIAVLTYQGGGDTSAERAIDFGLLLAGVDARKALLITPLVAGIALIGGIVLVAVGMKKSA